MSKLLIQDIIVFQDFVASIFKLIPACKFEINKDGCNVNGINDSRTVRAFFKTNSIISNEPVSFCIDDISKLNTCLNTLVSFNENASGKYELDFDNTFISCSTDIKFKLRLIKEDVIAQYVSNSLTTTLENTFGCKINTQLMKKLCSISSINSSDNPKVYITKVDDKIFAEVDDKEVRITNSIGIPLSNDFYGSWDGQVLIIKLDMFRLWNLVNADVIDINMTNKGVLSIINQKTKDSSFININIISSVLKN